MSDFRLLSLLKWVIRGKTLTRALLHSRLSSLATFNGVTLDLGGGGVPSYKELLEINGLFVNMDAISEARPTVVGNLERGHPFGNEIADSVILFNTLEHIFGYQHVVSEMFRVLKTGGAAYIYTPFVFPVHTHQTENFLVDDYFRYTESSLRRIFSAAGFSNVRIEPQGGLFIVIADFLGFALKFRPLKFMASIVCLALERIYRFVKPGVSATRYPLAYFVIATK